MANYALVRHKVRDFATWKVGFDGDAGHRAAFGISEVKVLQDSADTNNVFVLLQLESVERAQAFIHDPKLAEVMQQYGVTEKPDFHFLQD